MKYNEFIKAARAERGITLRSLGEKTGISYNHICHIENGEVKPSFETGLKLLLALDVPVGEFLEAIGYPDISTKKGRKRATGFEPATFSLGS